MPASCQRADNSRHQTWRAWYIIQLAPVPAATCNMVNQGHLSAGNPVVVITGPLYFWRDTGTRRARRLQQPCRGLPVATGLPRPPAVSGKLRHMNTAKPMLGFAAFSGTGKIEVDKPGKDSYRLRKAGAQQMLIASDQRMALMTENPTPQEPRLDELITRLELETVDLILVEGFKHVPFPKIELHREALGKTLLHPDDAAIIAIACDHMVDAGTLPILDINDTPAIAAFIIGWLQQQGET